MTTQILRISSKYLKPAFVVVSVIVLYRGHNEPGGGFIGGLLAASGYVFYMLAWNVKTALKKMWVQPVPLMAIGLLLAVASGLIGVAAGEPFMSGQWITVLNIKLGTPLLFDVGVYFTVIGVMLTIMSVILEKIDQWD
jgi:multisubunit Na+/H+ antiporter MnhB subunit